MNGPVSNVDYRLDRPAFWHYNALSEARDAAPVVGNTNCGGFSMVQRYDDVRSVLQDPHTFTNETISPFNPVQTLRLLPQVLNPPEQIWYRRVLNPWFSPASVNRRLPVVRAHCATLVASMVEQGSCDFVADFALRFPTDIFLHMLGLPIDDGALFLPWIETIFAGFFGGDTRAMAAAVGSIIAYFDARVAEREASPGDPETDFISYLLRSRIGDEPLARADLVTMCMTLSLAGLDTTRAQMGYIWHHHATRPADRELLVASPDLLPSAIEEFLRLYTLVLTAGRRVAADTTVAGCPMANRDVVWLGLLSANRDPAHFHDPDAFVADRTPNPHVAFGAGAHRCLGADLARAEIAVAFKEWHRLIPDYRLANDEPLTERGGQLTLATLPLVWP